jgi:hypothetical protein
MTALITRMLCYSALLLVGFMPIHAQAATAPIKEDTNTDYYNPSTNYGNAQSINVNINKQGFLNFDPSALPNSSIINKATLFIYVKSVGTAGGLQICPVVSPWLENDLTFTTAIPLQNALSCTLSSKIDPKQPALWNQNKPLPDGAFVAIDVTQLVKSGYYNFAVGIDSRYTSTNISFDSKEANQTSHHAYLDIDLTKSGGVEEGRKSYEALSSGRGTSVEIPEQIIADLCGDFDGCSLRIGMYNWDNTGRTASRETLFYYNNAAKTWRSSAGDIAGLNGNGATEHPLNAWACYFTDGKYTNWQDNGDLNLNFGLLSWNQYVADCRLTIID